MRCGCPECGEYMVQAEGKKLGCVCPVCGYHCRDCMGTNSVVSREELGDLAMSPRFLRYMMNDDGTPAFPDADEPEYAEEGTIPADPRGDGPD